ncbi:MAG: hypothetical protein ABMA01_09480 [Chthoniobacteraceae bacterium]
MRSVFAFVFLLLGAFPVRAREIKLAEGRVSLEVPDAFTPLTKEEIRIKYPSVNAPGFVVGNETRGVSIAYELKDAGMPAAMMVDGELPNAMKSFVAVFDRVIPGIQWIRKEVVERDGKRWIHLELTSNAIDQDIHNIRWITFFEKKLLLFNFNSTKSAFPAHEKELRRCAESIKLAK